MNFIEKDKVIRVEVGLTSTCNLECPLCIRQTHPEFIDNSPVKFRDKEEIIKQLEDYPNLEFITIAGAVSEPTLHPQLFDIIEHFIDRDLEISLFLNGDTHDDMYYKKLGLLFRRARGKVYFTICGSTQELHSKYRVNSDMKRVLKRLDIVDTYSKKAVLTWLVFNYNKDDFDKNHKMFSKYKTEYFNTLPVQEHFQLTDEQSKGIKLIPELHNIYEENIDRNDFENIVCPSIEYQFELVDFEGGTAPCVLWKLFGDKHCFECSAKNARVLRDAQIKHIAEPENENSEEDMRL